MTNPTDILDTLANRRLATVARHNDESVFITFSNSSLRDQFYQAIFAPRETSKPTDIPMDKAIELWKAAAEATDLRGADQAVIGFRSAEAARHFVAMVNAIKPKPLDIDALKPGREMDRIVGERVFGRWNHEPYSTSMAAAMLVVQHIEPQAFVKIEAAVSTWSVSFQRSNLEKPSHAAANNLPEAICRAALPFLETAR